MAIYPPRQTISAIRHGLAIALWVASITIFVVLLSPAAEVAEAEGQKNIFLRKSVVEDSFMPEDVFAGFRTKPWQQAIPGFCCGAYSSAVEQPIQRALQSVA